MTAERWATFDCYGTLADWVAGMRRAVEPFAGTDIDALMAAYYEEELVVQAEQPGLRYRDVLAVTLGRAAARCGLAVPAGHEHALADGWGELPIFADTRPALGALRDAGWRIGVLSNCDDDLLAQTLSTIAVPVDEVVSAQQVGSYKPARGHFDAFAARTEGRRATWVHCANSWVHDVRPATTLGIPCVWVDRDRTGHDPAPAAAHLGGLGELPGVLERLTAPAGPASGSAS